MVFSWANRAWIVMINDHLIANGITVWIDSEHIGRDDHDAIQRMQEVISASKIFIPCLSDKYEVSPISAFNHLHAKTEY